MYTKAIKLNNCCVSAQALRKGTKKMTKKEYFMNNAPCALLSISAFACYVLYGIEYSINDYAYIAYETDKGIQSRHRLMIHYTTDGSAFVILHGIRLHISEFCRI